MTRTSAQSRMALPRSSRGSRFTLTIISCTGWRVLRLIAVVIIAGATIGNGRVEESVTLVVAEHLGALRVLDIFAVAEQLSLLGSCV